MGVWPQAWHFTQVCDHGFNTRLNTVEKNFALKNSCVEVQQKVLC